MPIISNLKITNFRNLKDAEFNPAPTFNIIYGMNGAGKTSILEAIFYLGRGRSFRTSRSEPIIQHNSEHLTVFGKLIQDEISIPLGIERGRDGSRQIRINHESIDHIAPLIKQLPIQLIGTECHRFFYDGSKVRRQFVDWGVFHVEHSYLTLWKQYEYVLKQRNSALKQRRSIHEITIWNQEYCRLAREVDTLRTQYLTSYIPIANQLIKTVLELEELKISYESGWKKAKDYESALAGNIQRDLFLGRSELGSHRADIQIFCNQVIAHEYLSQGQLKCLSYALLLAQGILMQQKIGIAPIFLIDDLPSELDLNKRLIIFDILKTLNSQVFITGIESNDFQMVENMNDTCMFHVEQGNINAVAPGVPAKCGNS